MLNILINIDAYLRLNYLMKYKLLFVALFVAASSIAQIPSGYYSTATGTGFVLKTQLYNKITNHTNLGYAGLWSAYATTDRDNQYENDNTVFDLYSENPTGTDPVTFLYSTNQCGTYTTQANCYNREHIVPQSIFSSASPMMSDAHFIVPVDGYVNGMRSDNPHGNVAVASWTSLNGSKRGTSAVAGYTGTVFEPLDDFKGDIARMYFYFATRYENVVAGYTTYAMFNGTNNQVFSTPFLNMLISWHNQDTVSAREIARNNAIYNLQNNRNPFIDHPEYVGIIWGGSSVPVTQTITFNSLASVTYGSTFNLTATASSNLLVSYVSSNTNVATISGNVVTVIGIGTTTITASQSGNSFYNPAVSVSRTLTVTQAPQLITFNALPNKTIGSPPFTLSATGGNSGNPVTFTSSNNSVATISGNTVTIVGVGTTNITASELGNTNYLAAVDVVRSLSVSNGIIAGWDFSTLLGGTGTNNFGASPFNPTLNLTNCTVSGLIRGAGILAPNTSAAAARAWGGTVNTATSTTAITGNSTITFTLKPSIGYAMDLGSISPIDYRRSSTGATNALVQYSVNGGVFNNLSTLNFPISSSSGASAGTIDLTTIANLQNIHSSQTITIRILPYGGTGGTFYFYDRAASTAYDLSVVGNVRLCSTTNSTNNLSISSSALPYSWNGQNITTSGTYSYSTINSLGCDSIATLNLTIQPNYLGLNIKVFLEGLYLGNEKMTSAPFNADGISPQNIADTLTLELHDTLGMFMTLYSSIALLDTNGICSINIPNTFNNNRFYLAVKHRNSIETWSANPILLTSNTNYDFSNASNKSFGDNVKNDGGVFLLYCGDITQDGAIDFADYPLLDIDNQNGLLGYFTTDLTGDSSTDFSDYPIIDFNNLLGIITLRP
jgi:endonuclease I